MAAALARREELEGSAWILAEAVKKTKAAQTLAAVGADLNAVNAAIDSYALDTYQPGQGFESPEWKVTKVQGTTKVWNVDKLRSLVSHGLFKKMVSVSVDASKVDAEVKAGHVTLDEIEAAFSIKNNSPYVRITRRNLRDDGSEEAESLAAKLSA